VQSSAIVYALGHCTIVGRSTCAYTINVTLISACFTRCETAFTPAPF